MSEFEIEVTKDWIHSFKADAAEQMFDILLEKMKNNEYIKVECDDGFSLEGKLKEFDFEFDSDFEDFAINFKMYSEETGEVERCFIEDLDITCFEVENNRIKHCGGENMMISF